MFNKVKNVLFDPKKQNQPWRQYSPNGKRRRVVNIPFNGKISNIKAQGTKVIGVTPAAFSKHKYSHMSMYNFNPDSYTSFSANKYKPFYMYTAEERAKMTPDELKIAAQLQQREDFNRNYRKNSARRSTTRLGLDTIGEVRGLSRELRGWSEVLMNKKRFKLQQDRLDLKREALDRAIPKNSREDLL